MPSWIQRSVKLLILILKDDVLLQVHNVQRNVRKIARTWACVPGKTRRKNIVRAMRKAILESTAR